MKPSKIWISHWETAREILSESGVIQALDYLVGQKLAHYFEVAKTDADFKKELNAFQSEIWSIFKESELNAYLMNLVRTTAMYVGNVDDQDTGEMPVFSNAPEPDFAERAKVWLLRN